MEIVAPERRLIGYTTKPLVCPFPDLPPIVGYARTTTIRSVLASGLPAAEQQQRRIAYYEYVGTGPGPRINVIQDIDGPDAGFGAFWGEVQSSVHKALGSLGVITDGSIRDIAQWAPGFQALAGSIGPSHAYVHADNFGGEVRVAGMTVRSGDLIHADRHGAVVIPLDVAAKLPDAAELCRRPDHGGAHAGAAGTADRSRKCRRRRRQHRARTRRPCGAGRLHLRHRPMGHPCRQHHLQTRLRSGKGF